MKKQIITMTSFLFLAVSGSLCTSLLAAEPPFSKSSAVTSSRSGSFELDMLPEHALPLFTAPGEELWVPHWKPIILHGDGFEAGTVFLTSHNKHTTHWLVAEYDEDKYRAKYLRVTPEVDMGTVYVSIEPNGKRGSIVNVTYQLTGLSDEGNEKVHKVLNEKHYRQMMKEWRTMIENNKSKLSALNN